MLKLKSCRFALGVLTSVFIVVSCASAFEYKKKDLDPLAATAPDLAGLIMGYARHNPEDAAKLDDIELVKRAADFRDAMTPENDNYLDPYHKVLVRGTLEGTILVCTKDKSHALFEDAKCTDHLDRAYYRDGSTPQCEFKLDLQSICP